MEADNDIGNQDTMTQVQPYQAAALPGFVSRNSLASRLGAEGSVSGTTPSFIHTKLTRKPWKSLISDISTQSFTVSGHEFWWAWGTTQDGPFNKALDLPGQEATKPTSETRSETESAIEMIADYPWAFTLFKNYTTTLTYVLNDPGNPRPITSASFPDFPMQTFFSKVAWKHIPPRSVLRESSIHLLAENLFHESIHQYINARILTEPILPADFDSGKGVKVDISWRKGQGSESLWSLDRVFHAASVYTMLIPWRHEILKRNDLPPETRKVIEGAVEFSEKSLDELSSALQEHLESFTQRGAFFVGQMLERASTYTQLTRKGHM
ncbi:hypothetical protein [Nocardiopsis alkaliphila]|uniref:hypothetical protein n=1 Tax=Nocardiopsis alkaliphila TaxID=225762 RepID=UPI0003753DD4|nr:hypothetical protein [Nocardiopsis alkaliphila]